VLSPPNRRTMGAKGVPTMSATKKKSSKPKEWSGSVTVREMELEDLHRVYALGEKVFTADKWPNLYRTWDEYEIVDRFAADGGTCLVAEMDGEVVGFALGTVIEKRRSAWNYGYLLWLGVDPEVGPLGIGSKLFTRMQDLFIENGARMMLVDTAAENEHALEFFRKQGFGNETAHVYLSKNLTHEIETVARRKRRRSLSGANPAGPITGTDEGD
jgi:ribosomal protein S18 acetylase RimI-like enzyme